MGHLNSSGGGNLNKNVPKFKCLRGCPGEYFLSFNLTGTLHQLYVKQKHAGEHIDHLEETSTLK